MWFAVSTTVWQHLPPMGGSGTTARVTMRWAAATDVGRIRSVNEDSLLAEPPVFLVADGMGGHEAGDVASALAVDRLGGLVDSPPVRPEQVSELLGSANTEILVAGASQDDERAMGTTAVGLVLIDGAAGPSWMVFNIGDSRIYRCIDGVTEQLSVDHSYVQELLDAGRITEPAARIHPQRNVVTRALGVDTEAKADLWLRSPVPGERFLLCSDGLSGELAPEALQGVLSQPRSPEEVTEVLIDMALSAGGRDNISVIVVDVEAVDGVTYDDYSTAPRNEPTTENRPAVAREADGVDQSDVPPEGIELIDVPHEVVGVVSDTPPSPRGGDDADRPATMIAGVPSELPRADDARGVPVFDTADPKSAGSKDNGSAETPIVCSEETDGSVAGAPATEYEATEDEEAAGEDG